MKATRSHHGWVHMFITHGPTVTLQLHNFDLSRTSRTSSFCTVAWQLVRFQLTRRIARSLGDSWASCSVWTPHFSPWNPHVGWTPHLGSTGVMWLDLGALTTLRAREGSCCASKMFPGLTHSFTARGRWKFSSNWTSSNVDPCNSENPWANLSKF